MYNYTEPVNKAGDTPLSLACANGHLDTVKYLVNEHHCVPRSKLSLYVYTYIDPLICIAFLYTDIIKFNCCI